MSARTGQSVGIEPTLALLDQQVSSRVSLVWLSDSSAEEN